MIKGFFSLFRSFFEFLRDIYANRELVLTLVRRDIKARFLGSAFGLVWAFVQPTVTIFVMWFVFQYGLKSPPIVDFPFSLWLVTGMVPWFFFSEGLGSATHAVLEYHYLVKHSTVRLSLLPVVKILSCLIVHCFLVVLMLCMYAWYGYFPGIHSVQLLYYGSASIILLLGLSWITAALILFVRDVGQAVAIVLQLGFWFTPIIWNLNFVPYKYQVLLKLNPVLYLVEGYRDALVYNVWFWEHKYMSIYFWCFTVFTFCLGAVLFKRLRPHFADVI